MRRDIATLAILTLLAAALLTGCSAPTPSGDPAIRGTISSVSEGPDGIAGILVEGPIADGTTLDKAALSITDKTRILSASDEEVGADALGVGMRVEVWVTGPVAESYPVQADADIVRILN